MLAATSSSAFAGKATLHSTAPSAFTVTYERPSGEPVKEKLDAISSSPSSVSIDVPDKGTASVALTDLTGTTEVKGKVSDDGLYLLVSKGTGFTIAAAGTGMRSGSPYPGVVILNTLEPGFKVDLFGHSGKVGSKNVMLGTALDVKQAIKFAPGEERFKAVVHQPDGTDVELDSSVDLGRFYVFHKTEQGKVRISALGWIPVPEKATKKKK